MSKKNYLFLAILFLYPYIIFFIRKKSYVFRDALDVYTFMFEGILPLIFVFLAVFVYVGEFSNLLSERFIVYLRMRAPLKRILISCLCSNMVITFLVFFIFSFNLFIFSFYIEPSLGLVKYQPEVYKLNNKSVILDSFNRHTFTQLLEYGNFVYGLAFSAWIGLNALAYSTLGFFTVLLVKQKLLGITIPVIFYLIGTFILSFSNVLEPYRLADSVFPFSIGQQSISTSVTTLFFLFLLNLLLYIYTIKIKIHNLGNTV